VKVNRRKNRGVVVLRCEQVGAGTRFGRCGPSDDDSRFRVLDAITWDEWNAAVPPGPCPGSSSEATGGVHSMDLEVELKLSGKRRHPCPNLEVHLRGKRGLRDDLYLSIGGDWEGHRSGCAGIVTVTRVWRIDDDTWRVRLELVAPDRGDGNPGALPTGSGRLVVDLGRVRCAFDLEDWNGPDPACRHTKRGSWEATRILSVEGAGTCRRSDGA